MGNTGRKLVLSLKKVAEGTTSPTIETKQNVYGDPDYIAPYTSADCPVTYDAACPTVVLSDARSDIGFEFSLTDSTINNPDISTVRVEMVAQSDNVVTAFTVFSKPFTNFFAGSFTRPAIGSYYFNIIFFNSSNATVGTPCTGLSVFTVS